MLRAALETPLAGAPALGRGGREGAAGLAGAGLGRAEQTGAERDGAAEPVGAALTAAELAGEAALRRAGAGPASALAGATGFPEDAVENGCRRASTDRV